MGSPLSPLLCDIDMHYFGEKLFSVHKFPLWFRCVDDTFVLVPSNTDFSSLLSLVSLINSCIQFTLEVENNNSVSFLDVLVSKGFDRFSATVFRKSFSVSLPPHALYKQSSSLTEKVCFLYLHLSCFIYLLYPSNLSNKLNYLKSLALSQSYDSFVIDKALNVFFCFLNPLNFLS